MSLATSPVVCFSIWIVYQMCFSWSEVFVFCRSLRSHVVIALLCSPCRANPLRSGSCWCFCPPPLKQTQLQNEVPRISKDTKANPPSETWCSQVLVETNVPKLSDSKIWVHQCFFTDKCLVSLSFGPKHMPFARLIRVATVPNYVLTAPHLRGSGILGHLYKMICPPSRHLQVCRTQGQKTL